MNGLLMTRLTDIIKAKLLSDRWNAFYKNNKLTEISLHDIGIEHQDISPVFIEEICLPPFRGDESFDDYSVLFSILDFHRPKVILELGTGYGNTTANICAMMDSQVFTVNALPDQISGRVTTYSLTNEEIGKVYRTQGFSQRIVQIYEDTKKMDLSRLVSEKSVDFAIVDACHDSDYVLSDFLKIQPLMAPGSIVMLHDTHPSMEKHYIDSYIACMYLRKLGHNIKYIKNTSWAIWFEKDGVISKSKIKRILSSITDSIDKLIFGSQQNDLLRIRRHAKKNIA